MPEIQVFGLSVPESGRLKNLQSPYYVALHATSRDSKLWLVEHWRALLKKLNEEQQCNVYLPWGNETEKMTCGADCKRFTVCFSLRQK